MNEGKDVSVLTVIPMERLFVGAAFGVTVQWRGQFGISRIRWRLSRRRGQRRETTVYLECTLVLLIITCYFRTYSKLITKA